MLKLLAPYIAVVVFWCLWPNAWLAILAYHVQIVLWRTPRLHEARGFRRPKAVALVLPTVLTGPVLYVLLPFITRTDISSWLAAHRLSGVSLLCMIPYFGLVHPVLEQIHWHPLRQETAWFHPVFGGYHIVVLGSLLTIPWLILCLCVLVAASLAWKRMTRATGSLIVPAVSHSLADLGVIVAAWLRMR
jgi:hypothetical protein